MSNLNYYGIVNPDGVEADPLGFAGTRDVTVSGDIAQCYPLPESKLIVKPQFEPTEIMPKVGEKSPENPSTIEGKSLVYVNVHGLNLFEMNGAYLDKAVKIDEYSFRANIVNFYYTSIYSQFSFFKKNDTVSMQFDYTSSNDPIASIVIFYINNEGKKTYAEINEKYGGSGHVKVELTVPSDVKLITSVEFRPIRYRVRTTDTTTIVSNMMITKGAYNGKFELGTWDSYAFSLSNSFGGGYLDLERGKFIQTHTLLNLNKIEWQISSLDSADVRVFSNRFDLPYRTGVYTNKVCTHFPVSHSSTKYPYIQVTGGSTSTGFGTILFWQKPDDLGFMSFERWKAFLQEQEAKGTPVILEYKLFKPIEHDITPQLIKALPQGSFSGNKLNNIFADTNLPTEVTYKEPVVYFPIKEV